MRKQLEKAREIAKRLNADKCLIVGGFVRDSLLGVESKDLDLEVYGMGLDEIATKLSGMGHVDLVGQEFGVIKIDNEIDVAIPRRESKNGLGHKGFDVHPDPTMTPEEAASRRDFTINSMAMDMEGGIIDPFNGKSDLEFGILKATSAAYSEDPLRVLRGMQFASRFNMTMDHETLVMSEKMADEFDMLSKERIFTEWMKWTKGSHPKAGLDLLQDTKWIKKFPNLWTMVDVPQDPEWHPEGCCWKHTVWVCQAAAEVADRENIVGDERALLFFAALCHDLGKPYTTKKNDEGRLTSPQHASVGVPITKEFLNSINAPKWLLDKVPPLVAEHMTHLGVQSDQITDRVVRRLANRLAPSNMKMWSHVCEADHSGRPPLEKSNPVVEWMEAAERLAIEDDKPKPMLMGRHLIDLGMEPGIAMGTALKAAFEAQLDGEFDSVDGALEWVKLQLEGPKE